MFAKVHRNIYLHTYTICPFTTTHLSTKGDTVAQTDLASDPVVLPSVCCIEKAGKKRQIAIELGFPVGGISYPVKDN